VVPEDSWLGQTDYPGYRRRKEEYWLGKEFCAEELEGGGYLVEVGVVSSPDARPVGLSTHAHLHHRLDVVARELSTLDNTNTDLEKRREHPRRTRSRHFRISLRFLF